MFRTKNGDISDLSRRGMACIQRCQVHKRRNVVERLLPQSEEIQCGMPLQVARGSNAHRQIVLRCVAELFRLGSYELFQRRALGHEQTRADPHSADQC
jgi:hypothetical protein